MLRKTIALQIRKLKAWYGLKKRPQMCPRRGDPGPWKYPAMDYWRIEGKHNDRTCSFCGSLHPEDFLALLKLAISNSELCRIERSDKSYKFYIYRPDVKNAGDGAIKFYTHHLHDETLTHELNKLWKLYTKGK